MRRGKLGMTLVELLVVMAIVSLLIGMALPVMRPALEDRKMREAARTITAYFAGARAQAAALGRGVGVELERDVNDERVVTDLYIVEFPQPYSGDVMTDKCQIVLCTGNRYVLWFSDKRDALGRLDHIRVETTLASLVPYESPFEIKLDYREPVIPGKCIAPIPFPSGFPAPPIPLPSGFPASSFASYELKFGSVPSHLVGIPLSFQIFRSPVRSSFPPIQLPKGVVVDMEYSGTGAYGREFAPPPPPPPGFPAPPPPPNKIMFRPDGEATIWDPSGTSSASNIHLLVGKFEKMDSAIGLVNVVANLAEYSNLWITINHRTGSCIATENAGYPATATTLPLQMGSARKFALQSSAMGAK